MRRVVLYCLQFGFPGGGGGAEALCGVCMFSQCPGGVGLSPGTLASFHSPMTCKDMGIGKLANLN